MKPHRPRRMPRGFCPGCGDESDLPPFADGMCFLCATDGPPGQHVPTGGAVHEDTDARRWVNWPSDDDLELHDEVRAIFDEAQLRGASAGLGGDYRDRFCFSRSPNASTRARWLTRHLRPELRERKPKPAPKPKREPKPRRVVQGRRGPAIKPTSPLARTVAHVLAHPGCTIAEIAQAIGETPRTVSRKVASAQVGLRVLRTGVHGDARFYPGPRAVEQLPKALPERHATLSCVLPESALTALERRAAAAGVSVGEALANVLEAIGDTTTADVVDALAAAMGRVMTA